MVFHSVRTSIQGGAKGSIMSRRKLRCYTGGFYHLFNKSIAGFEIFRYPEEYARMREMTRFYRDSLRGYSYSEALKRGLGIDDPEVHGVPRIRLIAYCFMPTHFHFLVSQLSDDGAEDFMRCLQAGYAIYLNKRSRRRGPLWEGRFGIRRIETDGDLLHMTRYVHLNPTSAGIVQRPGEWPYSSYHEYTGVVASGGICDFKQLISLSPQQYHKFVSDRNDYQRSLQIIKSYLMD